MMDKTQINEELKIKILEKINCNNFIIINIEIMIIILSNKINNFTIIEKLKIMLYFFYQFSLLLLHHQSQSQ